MNLHHDKEIRGQEIGKLYDEVNPATENAEKRLHYI